MRQALIVILSPPASIPRASRIDLTEPRNDGGSFQLASSPATTTTTALQRPGGPASETDGADPRHGGEWKPGQARRLLAESRNGFCLRPALACPLATLRSATCRIKCPKKLWKWRGGLACQSCRLGLSDPAVLPNEEAA